jgi:outer membrane beta-barrel protein
MKIRLLTQSLDGIGIKRFINIAITVSLLFTLSHAELGWAKAPQPGQQTEQVIEPQIMRRDVQVPDIDTENFEVSGFFGVLNTEDFGSSLVYGARLAYHITEDFFAEAAFARSSVSDESLRSFAITVFENQEENLYYYNLSVGFNALPGEVFVGKNRAWTSSLYLITGAGNTHFNDEDYFTVNVGFGVKLIPLDWLSIRVDVRDHIFASDLLGESKTTNNLELTGNLGFFF